MRPVEKLPSDHYIKNAILENIEHNLVTSGRFLPELPNRFCLCYGMNEPSMTHDEGWAFSSRIVAEVYVDISVR